MRAKWTDLKQTGIENSENGAFIHTMIALDEHGTLKDGKMQ